MKKADLLAENQELRQEVARLRQLVKQQQEDVQYITAAHSNLHVQYDLKPWSVYDSYGSRCLAQFARQVEIALRLPIR